MITHKFKLKENKKEEKLRVFFLLCVYIYRKVKTVWRDGMDNGYKNYRRYLEGDDDALAELMKEYENGLILYINSIVHDIAFSRELSDEVFFRLALKKPAYKENYSFKAWLYAIGRNLAKNHLTRFMVKVRAESLDEPIVSSEDLERADIKNEEKLMLHRTMKKLKTQHQQVLTLVYFEQLSNAEAAEVMHKTVRQIENLLYRAKISLKAELEKEGFEYERL